MQIFRNPHDMQRAAIERMHRGLQLGFVPTMGYLHEGHLSLVREAKKQNDLVCVSIYVNPTQFAPHEDFNRYPHDEARDLDLLKKEKVDWVFIPSHPDMYPEGFSTYVQPPEAAQDWEGASRPTHFRGVCTVVTLLFNLILPTRAYFGRKDAQQAVVIRGMARDLRFPAEVVVCPTVREGDGLAMSSRNVYLSKDERRDALILSKTLALGVRRFHEGVSDSNQIFEEGLNDIRQMPSIQLDYLGIVDHNSFKPVSTVTAGNFYIGAIYVGKTRLIDNMVF